MKLIFQNTIIIEKSKFIGYLYYLDNIEEINDILLTIKSINKKADHFPYSYVFNNQTKKSDDKEPSGTAGNPILFIMNNNNLNNHLIVIARYFGGKKLGTGLLTRSYMNCAKQLIKELPK